MNNTKLLVLILIAVIVGYLFISLNSLKTAVQPTTENIKDVSGLDQAQDQLNTVNIDGVDTGLNQLNTEISTF